MSLRLEELGFTAAAQVTCILKGRRGHMSAYQIQGTVIALRPQNAREVLVRVLNPG
jgi:ferrous iron transport protein A